MDGSALVFLDHYCEPHFDLSTWDYCYSNEIFPVAIPPEISAGIRALNLGVMAKYTSLMMLYIHSR